MLINLAAPTDQAKSRGTSDTSGTGVDQLRGIENVIAGNFADSVTGNAAANRIEGMNGNDILTAFRVGSPVTEQHFLSSPGTTTATTSDQRLVYDSSAGVLYYDPDGAGGQDALQLAVFSSSPTLSASDFIIST